MCNIWSMVSMWPSQACTAVHFWLILPCPPFFHRCWSLINVLHPKLDQHLNNPTVTNSVGQIKINLVASMAILFHFPREEEGFQTNLPKKASPQCLQSCTSTFPALLRFPIPHGPLSPSQFSVWGLSSPPWQKSISSLRRLWPFCSHSICEVSGLLPEACWDSPLLVTTSLWRCRTKGLEFKCKQGGYECFQPVWDFH